MSSSVMSARDVLAREFLEMRAKILELAASLDRMDRGEGSVALDPRMRNLHQGLAVLKEASLGRAERIQLLFSRDYDHQWRSRMDI